MTDRRGLGFPPQERGRLEKCSLPFFPFPPNCRASYAFFLSLSGFNSVFFPLFLFSRLGQLNSGRQFRSLQFVPLDHHAVLESVHVITETKRNALMPRGRICRLFLSRLSFPLAHEYTTPRICQMQIDQKRRREKGRKIHRVAPPSLF